MTPCEESTGDEFDIANSNDADPITITNVWKINEQSLYVINRVVFNDVQFHKKDKYNL